MDFEPLRQLIAELNRQGALRIILQLLVILVVAALALRGAQRTVNGIVGQLFDREATEGTAQELSALEVAKRKETLQTLGGGAARTMVLIIALLMALQVLTIDIGPAIAGLGIAGIALGLGAQSLVKDYLAGAFILIENQYGKGDVVSVAGVTGTVEDLSLRRTTMRDLDGTVHMVPNGLIGVASNLTRVWARINLDVAIKDPARLEDATAIVDRVGQEMAEDPAWRKRVLSAPKVDRVKGLAATGVTLKVLGTVSAADRWAAAGELRRRVAAAFGRTGSSSAAELRPRAPNRPRGCAATRPRFTLATATPSISTIRPLLTCLRVSVPDWIEVNVSAVTSCLRSAVGELVARSIVRTARPFQSTCTLPQLVQRVTRSVTLSALMPLRVSWAPTDEDLLNVRS